jgi:hypothetical protein
MNVWLHYIFWDVYEGCGAALRPVRLPGEEFSTGNWEKQGTDIRSTQLHSKPFVIILFLLLLLYKRTAKSTKGKRKGRNAILRLIS